MKAWLTKGGSERGSKVNGLPAEGKQPVFGEPLLGLLEETRGTLQGKPISTGNRRGMWALLGAGRAAGHGRERGDVNGSCSTSAELGGQAGSDHQHE